MERDILLAAVIGAQGLKGEVKAKAFTALPESLARYRVLHARDGRTFHISSARVAKGDIVVLSLDGVNDRNAAEALKGTELFVKRSALEEPEQEEYYHADLIGLRAEDEEGRHIGTLAAIHNYGAGDVLEISRPDGGDVLVPFTHEFAPTIDIASGRIVIAVPRDEAAEEQGDVE